MVLFLVAKLQIFHREPAARGYFVRRIGVAGDNHCVFNDLFQFRDAGVQFTLLVFRLIILSVLRQVAEGTRFLQLLGDLIRAVVFRYSSSSL